VYALSLSTYYCKKKKKKKDPNIFWGMGGRESVLAGLPSFAAIKVKE
jgi:hypothetical protein